MAYSQVSFGQLKTQVSERLNDPTQTFWPNQEVGLYIQDALRFWNCLTGENKQWYNLAVSPTSSNAPWYDLQTLAGSPRISSLTDQDVYLRLTYQLLESPSSTAAVVSKQFSQDDLIQAVQRKRDQFLFETGCTMVVQSLNVNPNLATVVLPQTVIQVLRSYWLPAIDSGTLAMPLFRGDEWQTAAYGAGKVNAPDTPISYSAGIEPPLTVVLTPPPAAPGSIECLVIASQGFLSASGSTKLLLPSDFMPGLLWGALSDLLMINIEAQDVQRSRYVYRRYMEYMALIETYAFVMAARVNGVPGFVDAVETLDFYSPGWRNVTSSPNIVATSGQNLVAYPTSQSAQISLLLVGNANVPILDEDNIQLGDEILDVIIDEAVSVASTKMGGAEAAAAWMLHENIIRLAAKKNAKIRALGAFRDTLYGRSERDKQFAPMEVSGE